MVARVCESRSTSLLLRLCYSFFCKLHVLLNHEHIGQNQREKNRDDGFETCHFDEGRPYGELPYTSLVQRSRMSCRKDLCLVR